MNISQLFLHIIVFKSTNQCFERKIKLDFFICLIIV